MPTCIVGLIFLFYRERELGKKNFLEREDAFFFMVYFPHFHQIYIYINIFEGFVSELDRYQKVL